MTFQVFVWILLIALAAAVSGALAVGFGLLQRGKTKQDRELIVTRAETEEARHRARLLAIQRERELDALLGKQLPMKSSAADDVDDIEPAYYDKKDVEQAPDERVHWADQETELGEATVLPK